MNVHRDSLEWVNVRKNGLLVGRHQSYGYRGVANKWGEMEDAVGGISDSQLAVRRHFPIAQGCHHVSMPEWTLPRLMTWFCGVQTILQLHLSSNRVYDDSLTS